MHDPQVICRFYEELNDFLPHKWHKTDFTYELNAPRNVKDLIESIGVPHTEIELILVNGKSVDFNYKVQADDRISVYPMFETLDMSSELKLRQTPLRTIKFVLDCHLGKLAKYLRMAGFDTLYKNDYSDQELASISSQKNRILLTRDLNLLKRRIIDHARFVRQTKPLNQLREIIERFDLYKQIRPMTRCIRCNGLLTEVDKSIIEEQLEPKTKRYYEYFKQCQGCQQIYWRGSHCMGIVKIIESLQETGKPDF